MDSGTNVDESQADFTDSAVPSSHVDGNTTTGSHVGPSTSSTVGISWTVGKVFWTLGVFILAGIAEIGGGWLVWQFIRNKKPWYFFVGGAAVLVAYGVIPTLQPEGASFSRVYAVYGGIFIVMSYAWGWVVDGDRPDTGDWVGSAVALAGVAVAWFWPRGGGGGAQK